MTFHLINGKEFRKIFSLITIDGFSFDVEMFVIANLLDLKIKEMPIKMKINRRFRFYHSVKMFIEILKISYQLRVIHHYQKKINQLEK